MKRILQPDLMRGRVAQGVAVLLWVVLLAVLLVSVVSGFNASKGGLLMPRSSSGRAQTGCDGFSRPMPDAARLSAPRVLS